MNTLLFLPRAGCGMHIYNVRRWFAFYSVDQTLHISSNVQLNVQMKQKSCGIGNCTMVLWKVHRIDLKRENWILLEVRLMTAVLFMIHTERLISVIVQPWTINDSGDSNYEYFRHLLGVSPAVDRMTGCQGLSQACHTQGKVRCHTGTKALCWSWWSAESLKLEAIVVKWLGLVGALSLSLTSKPGRLFSIFQQTW